MPDFVNRQSFLSGCQRRFGECQLPFSGMRVRFRSLTEGEQSKYELDAFQRDDSGALARDENGNLIRDEIAMAQDRSRLIVLCLVDEGGNQILKDADVTVIDEMDGADSRFLTQVLREHCGIIPRRESEAKKNGSSTNSEPSPESDSPTTSPPM